MKFGLSTPFRTLLNLETEAVSVHRNEAFAVMDAALRQITLPTDILSARLIDAGTSESKLGFRSLDEDQLAWFSRPVLVLTLDPAAVARKIGGLAPETQLRLGLSGFSIERAYVDLYDNTIAVLSICGSFSPTNIKADGVAGEFEGFFSDIGQCICETINNEFLALYLEKMSAFDRKRNKIKVLRPARRFEVFSDLNAHPFPRWDETLSSCFWTHRVFSKQDVDANDGCAALLRYDELVKNGVHDRDGSVFHVGTSFISRDDLLDQFLFASSIAQYYFCLFDIMNANQNQIFRLISLENNKNKLQKLIRRYSRMEDFIGYIENELIDVELSLQHVRKTHFVHLCQVFSISRICDVIKGRDVIVEARIKRRSYFVGRSDRRVVKFFLVILASLQVLQLLVDLFAFSSSPRKNAIYGLHDVFSWIDFNVTTNIFALILVVGAIYASYRSEE
ncbi:hypothetical protein [Roseibium litorale]|uniref:Uncharacterized protein n=1 Tax=Roseibium litorale TaxID=2803841 RepID=A0ABR9CJT9_9HYPH|nr:hypothetical protein [Roseibium litorale]MBD8891107.1 hypothetical protein [Roseibium litorale]